jgi:hypothetical protein
LATINDIKTFVLLKYEIITADSNTWHLCDTYPAEIKSKWGWRIADDVEHFAKGYPAAEECIRVAKAYRDGVATQDELNMAWSHTKQTNTGAHCNAAYTATAERHGGPVVAYWAARISYQMRGGTYAEYEAVRQEKWKLYISWLIEELCEYETNINKVYEPT